ncbi:30S ribosomal S17P protein [Fusarium subglutinans]|uniref:30S ribosomal S17P protein n=1 Tax=Gibberella subglutinans TaxID=42677 RepID=A0A8H5P403_GIBSU|nr:30S ribosomal S17P protein [Fusarium subglutinans]KAF5590091.1 30S ribosomal S17P protein [Fusarium subglutinans]
MASSDNTIHQALDNNSDDQKDLGRAIYMHRLALDFRNHFHNTREAQSIEEAIDMAETPILIASDSNPNQRCYCPSLALVLGDQFCYSGLPDPIKHAIEAAHRALELAPKGCLNRLCYLNTLSYMLYDQFGISNNHDSLRDSLKVIEAVQECPESHPDRPEYVDHFDLVLVLWSLLLALSLSKNLTVA